MIKSITQNNQKATSKEASLVLVLVSLFVCYVASAVAGSNASGASEITTNIVCGPAFSTECTGQLVSTESNNSVLNLTRFNDSRTLSSGFLFSGNRPSHSIGYGSALAGIDNLVVNASGFKRQTFLFYYTAAVIFLSRTASIYAPIYNYASEEKYQA